MSDDDMHTRLSRLEWRQDALEESQRRQEERMSEMSGHMNARFDQVLEAIGSLKDDRAKHQGATEARQRMAKWIGIGLAAIGTVLALIGFNSSEAAWIPVDAVADAPIHVQQHSRDVP